MYAVLLAPLIDIVKKSTNFPLLLSKSQFLARLSMNGSVCCLGKYFSGNLSMMSALFKLFIMNSESAFALSIFSNLSFTLQLVSSPIVVARKMVSRKYFMSIVLGVLSEIMAANVGAYDVAGLGAKMNDRRD